MEHRSATRVRTVLKAEIRYNDGLMRTSCLVRDLSETGARLELSGEMALPEQFDLYIEKKRQTRRVTVKRQHGRELGVAFIDVAGGSSDPELPERVAKLEAEVAALRELLDKVAGALKVAS